MKISKQARQEAKQLLRSCGIAGQLDEARVRQVVQQVIARKPRGYLAILAHFQRLLRLELNRRTARMESALSLDAAQQAAVKGNLEKLYGPGLDFVFSANPALVGGLRVQVGSDVYDGSVRARLTKLVEQF
jgi:F-type H+-transporting ATPase subunit delta